MDRYLISTSGSGETEHVAGSPVREALIGESVTIRLFGTLSSPLQLIEKPEGSSAVIEGTTLVPDLCGAYVIKGPAGTVMVFACEMACLDRIPVNRYIFGQTVDGGGTAHSTTRMDQRLVLRGVVNGLNGEARGFSGRASSLASISLRNFGCGA